MNVTFRLPTDALEAQFARQAAGARHGRSHGASLLGGLRASLYNALPLDSAAALVQFMAEFQRVNG